MDNQDESGRATAPQDSVSPNCQLSTINCQLLADLYPTASARAKVDPDFADKAAKTTVLLQNGDPEICALWKEIRAVSVADLAENYRRLGVSFDCWYGESDADAYVDPALDLLRAKNLLVESDGAQVVDVARPDDKEPMPPIILVKSDGGDIYGTTDLATILQRTEDFAPDQIWYVVDNRQALHFKQVFRAAKLAGLSPDCEHLGFGTMNGKDGKPYKTRDGGVMRLSDLIDTVVEGAREKIGKETVENLDETALQIGVSALKVGDMLNQRTKDYVFELDRFLSTEGKTGPYLQYTAVRIRSLLQKAADADIAPAAILPPADETERNLMLAAADLGEGLLRAFHDRAPNVICELLFGLAQPANRFYFEHKVLAESDATRRSSWLTLLTLTNNLLTTLLEILGIEIPRKM